MMTEQAPARGAAKPGSFDMVDVDGLTRTVGSSNSNGKLDEDEVPVVAASVPVTAEVDLALHPSGIVPTLQYVDLSLIESRNLFSFARNIVSTVNLECRLDLKMIALHARNAEYNPKVTPFGVDQSLL